MPTGTLLRAAVTRVAAGEAQLSVNGQTLTVRPATGLQSGSVLLVRVPSAAADPVAIQGNAALEVVGRLATSAPQSANQAVTSATLTPALPQLTQVPVPRPNGQVSAPQDQPSQAVDRQTGQAASQLSDPAARSSSSTASPVARTSTAPPSPIGPGATAPAAVLIGRTATPTQPTANGSLPAQLPQVVLVDVLPPGVNGQARVQIDGRDEFAATAQQLAPGGRYVMQVERTPAGLVLRPPPDNSPSLLTDVAAAILRGSSPPNLAVAVESLLAELASVQTPPQSIANPGAATSAAQTQGAAAKPPPAGQGSPQPISTNAGGNPTTSAPAASTSATSAPATSAQSVAAGPLTPAQQSAVQTLLTELASSAPANSGPSPTATSQPQGASTGHTNPTGNPANPTAFVQQTAVNALLVEAAASRSAQLPTATSSSASDPTAPGTAQPDATANLSTPAVRNAAVMVRDAVQSFMPAEDRPLNAAQLQSLVENGGLLHEAKLARLANDDGSARDTGASPPPGGVTHQNASAPDLKEGLLRLLQAAHDLGAASQLPAARTTLDGIETQQAANVLAQAQGTPYVLQVPFPDGGQWRTLNLAIEPDRNGQSESGTSNGFRMLMHVPLTNLGETWIDAGLAGSRFRAVLYLENAGARSQVRAELPELRDDLLGGGFGEVLLDVRSSADLPARQRQQAAAMLAGRTGSGSVLDVRV